jgi:hypothetical protein
MVGGGPNEKKFADFPSFSNLKNDPWISLWLYRFGQYIALFGIVAISGILILHSYQVFPTKTENSLYFLGAMVQAQAAIVSLVITLTLIAIQMTAGSYTPRVVDVMKKNPDMWFLLVIYIESISLGFFALKSVVQPEDQALVSLIFVLGIYTFLTLFLYMHNTINLLRPDMVVKLLVNDLNAGNIRQNDGSADVMQPVFDVVLASINRFDITTTRAGLDQLSHRVLNILESNTFNDDTKGEITRHFCKHIKQSSLIALRNEDEGTIIEILSVLDMFSKKNGGRDKGNSGIDSVISVIRFIGINAADKGLEDATDKIVESLNAIVNPPYAKKLNTAVSSDVEVRGAVGEHDADKGLEDATVKVVAEALGMVGVHAADKGLAKATSQVVSALGQVGKKAMDKGFEAGTLGVINALKAVGTHTSDNKLENATQTVLEVLRDISNAYTDRLPKEKILPTENPLLVGDFSAVDGKSTDYKKIEAISFDVVGALRLIGNHSIDNELKNSTLLVVDSLGVIGHKLAYNKLNEITDRVTNTLGEIGEYSLDKGFQEGIPNVVRILCDFGFNNISRDAAVKNLAKLCCKSGVKIKKEIDFFESKMRSPKKSDFKSFKDQVMDECNKTPLPSNNSQ